MSWVMGWRENFEMVETFLYYISGRDIDDELDFEVFLIIVFNQFYAIIFIIPHLV